MLHVIHNNNIIIIIIIIIITSNVLWNYLLRAHFIHVQICRTTSKFYKSPCS